jgi:DNA-binding transcriptional regulator GbsR (MarR family)
MNQLTLEDYLQSARFEGVAEGRDCDRLCGQILRVYDAIYSGRWMTLDEIHQATGDPEASISARIRHLRKYRFGAHDIQKRRRNDGNQWEYRLWRIG